MEKLQYGTREYWDAKLASMFNPQWNIDYNNEQKAKFEALLTSTYVPKNHIERQLFRKAKEYATEQLQWLADGAKEDERGSSEYDKWLDAFLTECGVPADNTAEIEYNVNKPYPANEFCRDGFTVWGFYEMTVEKLIELAEDLKEDWSLKPTKNYISIVEDILSNTDEETDQTIRNTLVPTDETEVDDEQINLTIQGLANSKNLMHRLFSVVLLCAVQQNKMAFILTKNDMGKLLDQNKLIGRKTINEDYKNFRGFAFSKGWLKMEVDNSQQKRKGSLVSFDGQIKELLKQRLDGDIDNTIQKIVDKYKSKNKQKVAPVVSPDEVKPRETSTSDSELVNKAMDLQEKFNEIDLAIIPGISQKVNRYGSFKSEAQRNIILRFLQIHGA